MSLERWPAYLLVLAAAVRLLFILSANLPFESDEAIVGLMARHILNGGGTPLFYYGQKYLGPLEALSAAAVFALAGSSVVALRIAPTLYSMVFAIFTYRYTRRVHGAVAGLGALAYLAVPPLFLLTWSVKARGGYAELLALGAIMVSLVADLGEGTARGWWRWLALGAVSGLALWTDPLAVVYLVPCGVYLVTQLGWRLLHWQTGLSVTALVVSSGPMLLDNLGSRGETFRQLAGANGAGSLSLLAYRHNLVSTIQQSLPILSGLYQASSNQEAFLAARAQTVWPSSVATALAVALFLGLMWSLGASVRRVLARQTNPDDLVIWVAAATLALFCLSEAEALYLTEPRYLLPMYAVIPALAGRWWRIWRWQPPLAAFLLLATLFLDLSSIRSFRPALAAPHLDGQVIDAANPELVAFLDRHQIRYLYTDYWLAYPLAFQCNERIIASVMGSHLDVGFNRYIPYAVAVNQAPDPGVLVVADSPTERELVARFRRDGRSYHVSRWGNLDLYQRITPVFRPDQI